MTVVELFFMACLTTSGSEFFGAATTVTTCTWHPSGLYKTEAACQREGALGLGTTILGFMPRGKREKFSCYERSVSE